MRNFLAGNFCIWPQALPRCRFCRAPHGRKSSGAAGAHHRWLSAEWVH